jgi:transposase InsO family protein
MTTLLRPKAGGSTVERARRLMRKMGIVALGPKPSTRKPAPRHKIIPYLLGGMTIDRANEVWAADITYIPIARGFLYLIAIAGVTAVEHDGRIVSAGGARGGVRVLRRRRKAHVGIGAWSAFYNARRPHQALANGTSMALWRGASLAHSATHLRT